MISATPHPTIHGITCYQPTGLSVTKRVTQHPQTNLTSLPSDKTVKSADRSALLRNHTYEPPPDVTFAIRCLGSTRSVNNDLQRRIHKLPLSLQNCKPNVKLSLCLINHNALKMYGEWKAQLHEFLTSALALGEWSNSRPGHLTSARERFAGTNEIGACVAGNRATVVQPIAQSLY